jgi:predicted nucleotidyltransferase
MGNIFYDDFREFIQALNDNNVEYLLVGGYSVIYHGYARTTGDMDIWVNRTEANYKKIVIAFKQFKMPLFDMNEDNFLNHKTWDVFSYGTPPVCIDILVKVKGLQFDECYGVADVFEDDGLKIRTINYNHLLIAKKSSNRPKDIDDINNLTK